MSWGKLDDSIFEHPKTQVTAKDLRIPIVHAVGHLSALWSGARKFAEDGDLSRFDDDMIAGLARYAGDAAKFVRALQSRGWLDGKLIHDWLDYNGDWLRAKYKTRHRDLLVAIWAKHGRRYGRDAPEGMEPDDEAGRDREQSGKQPGTRGERQDKALDQPLGKALSPQAQGEKEAKSPNGGSGGKCRAVGRGGGQQGSQIFPALGLRAQGLSPPADSLPCGGFTAEEVFLGFETIFKFHGIHAPYDLQRRVEHCRVTPARWTMLFLDKIDAAYRDHGGATLADATDADPVGMTVSGFLPKSGGPVHTPTDSARGFFIEAMQDGVLARSGQKSRYKGNITVSTVVLELGRRKGKRT